MIGFVNVEQISRLSGITRQAVEKALKKIIDGAETSWRGASLIVREVRGRGGRSGVSYEVRIDSLPIELQERWKALHRPLESRLNHGRDAQIERDWWHGLLSPALAHGKHSRERSTIVKSIAERKHLHPNGSMVQYSVRTLQRRLEGYELNGMAAFGRQKRLDAGEARTFVTLRWDRAVSADDETKDRIANDLRQYIRGLIHKGESPSGIVLLASSKLADWTVGAGFSAPADEMVRLCKVPLSHVQRESVHRAVRRFDADRKAHEDAKPRIRRTYAGLMPMDIVVADVHPVDIYVRRADGSVITPKAISWLDMATRRIWFDPILLDKGDGIRNADVIMSFARMVREWGAPRALYYDNGSEYNWAEFLDDALKLIDAERRRIIGTIAPWADRPSNLIRAKPYNASAKPIEGVFGILEKTVFQTIPGWVGGDRMRKKTATVGRPVEPYPGDFDDLKRALAAGIAFYETKPQRGELRGKSPRQAWEDAIANGWGATAVDPNALRIAFSDRITKTVRQGAITHKGKRYTCRELQAHLAKTVNVLIPKYEDWSALPLAGEKPGDIIGFATYDAPYAVLDPAGAVESEARAKHARKAIQALKASVSPVDPNAERLAFLEKQPHLLAPPTAHVIGMNDEAARIAGRIGENEDERLRRQWREQQERQDEIDEERRARIEVQNKFRLIMGRKL